MAAMNYLYFKVSDAPVKVGDLTTEGIIKERTNAGDFIVQINNNETDVFGGYYLQALIPLLIMDAPEGYSKYTADRWQEFEVLKKNAIPFHSNEQVYEYIKVKGIKPEAEMLIEFDGEVVFDSCSDECKQYGNCDGSCNFNHKYALIKQPNTEDPLERLRNYLSPYLTLANLVKELNSDNQEEIITLLKDCLKNCNKEKINQYLNNLSEQPVQESEEEKDLTDFLDFVDKKTTFFQDKDVTIGQVVNEYLFNKKK